MDPILSQSSPAPPVATHNMLGSAAVTDLQLTAKYIALALDNKAICIFNPDGTYRQTLRGHRKAVWITAIHEDTLLSGSLDADIRVWSLETGSVFQLRFLLFPNIIYLKEKKRLFYVAIQKLSGA